MYDDRKWGRQDRERNDKYKRSTKESTRHEEKHVDKKPLLRITVNTISGGFAKGSLSTSARKRHVRVMQYAMLCPKPLR